MKWKIESKERSSACLTARTDNLRIRRVARDRCENRRHESSFPQLRGIKILLLFSHASLHSVQERRIYVYANTLFLRIRILRRYVIFFLLLFYYHKFKLKRERRNRIHVKIILRRRAIFFSLNFPRKKILRRTFIK